MAIGITGDTHLLIDTSDTIQQAVELAVSRVRDNINAGVTQRIYADGVQRFHQRVLHPVGLPADLPGSVGRYLRVDTPAGWGRM